MNDKDLTRDALLQELQQLRERLRQLDDPRHESRILRVAVDAQIDTFFLFDPVTGTPILWNTAFREISEYSDQEIGRMKAPDDWYSEADLARAAAVVEATSQGEQSTVELNLITKSGKRVPTEYKTAVIDDHAGPPYIISIGRDLSARKAQEQLIARERKQYHDFLDNLDAGVVAHAPDSSILYCNRRAMELLGLTRDQMEGKTAMDPQWRFLNEDGSDMALEDYPVVRTLKTLSKLEHYVCGIRGSGDTPVRWVVCNSLPVLNDDGELAHILISFFDITQRVDADAREKVLSESLARAQRLESLGLLAGGVAHDLNNMLGPIVGLPDSIITELQSLDFDQGAKTDLEEALHVIQSAGQRAANVVRDLLGLSRSGHSERVPTLVNSLPYISGFGKELEDMRNNYPGLRFEHAVSDQRIVVNGVSENLTRALHNLILNAAQAMSGDGTVTIGAKTTRFAEDHVGYETIPAGDYAVVSVADSGTGIAHEDLEHIFDPFFSRTEKHEHGGTGLGLSVVHRLVKDHKGYIDVVSHPGQGTTVSIYLPLQDCALIDTSQHAYASVAGGTESILIVDDEPMQRYLAQRILELRGYQLSEVDSGRAAVKLFDDHARNDVNNSPFDLVLLDMVMESDFDGLDTLRAIRSLYPQQQVIIISGHAKDHRASATMALGAVWLSKPYKMTDLEGIVRKTLDRSQAPDG